ncbi:MAG: hypothetical protein UT26_C0021G0009 [Microgenomates group bacterium GW2011_GWC1_39_12]|nr:MAG: hypothetical protein UT26_C0021G0009 [Microgenomates group bacterium GW2011_GWC1_39_12]
MVRFHARPLMPDPQEKKEKPLSEDDENILSVKPGGTVEEALRLGGKIIAVTDELVPSGVVKRSGVEDDEKRQ